MPKLTLQSLIAGLAFTAFPASAATVLGVSDIMFAGFSSEGTTEDFSFVTFVDLEAGTEIRFTDRPWTGSALDATNNLADGEIVWTAGSAITAGSVVVISMDPGNSFAAAATTGTATGSFGTNSGLSTAGEIIFAYQGTAAEPDFIHGLNYRDVYDTPTAGDTLDSLLPTVLNVPNGNTLLPVSFDNGQFDARNSLPTLADYKAALSNPANWTLSDDDLALTTTPFTAVPEPSAAVLLGLGAAGLVLRRRRAK